ncbi:MAG: HNH endonuclease [Gammaproteobacteria bacterium]
MAKAENPTATSVFCQRHDTATQVDHAIPRARGGNATLDNAQLACPHFNPSKGVGNFPKTPPPGYTGPWPP